MDINRPVWILNVTATPHIIRYPGRVKVSADMLVRRPLPQTLSADVIITKYIFGHAIKLPCLKNLGSWWVIISVWFMLMSLYQTIMTKIVNLKAFILRILSSYYMWTGVSHNYLILSDFFLETSYNMRVSSTNVNSSNNNSRKYCAISIENFRLTKLLKQRIAKVFLFLLVIQYSPHYWTY
jgi:hypothetical protein